MSTLADVLDPVELPPLAWLASFQTYTLEAYPAHPAKWRLVRWVSSGLYSWLHSDATSRNRCWIDYSPPDVAAGSIWAVLSAPQGFAANQHRDALVRTMEHHGLVAHTLADLAHTRQPHVWAMMRGDRPITDAVTYALNLMLQGVSPDDLLDWPKPAWADREAHPKHTYKALSKQSALL